MPEGLAMFGTGISDLIEMHTDAECVPSCALKASSFHY